MRNPDPRPLARPTSTARPHRAGSPRPTPGQALVETAIGIVLLMLLTFSVVDAAMLFYIYLTLQNGVTEATRFAVTGQDPDAIKRVILDATPGLNINEDTEIFLNDISDPNHPIPGAGQPNSIILVKVVHPWRLISPLLWPLVGNGGRITLSVSATMKNEPPPTG